MPFHPEIIRLGFLDYVDQARPSGSNRVFVGWEPDSLGGYSSAIPRWWNRTHLVLAGIKTRKLVFHSLRHSFTGHGIVALGEQMARDTFSPLDLSHLY